MTIIKNLRLAETLSPASKSLLAISSICFGLLNPLNSQAQTEFSDDEVPELYITANKVPTAVDRTGSSLNIVHSEEIEELRGQDALEALRAVPGLNVVQSGGRGRVASVFLRGAESDHTLVLIDGVRVNANGSGEFDISNLNAADIERIEILKGAQSVLYGSEAIGGVVNIITKKTTEGLDAKVLASAGSFGTRSFKGNAGLGSEDFSFNLNFGVTDIEGFSAASEANGNTEDDEFENLTLGGQVSGTFLEDGKASLRLRHSASETGVDGFDFEVGPVDDLNFTQETDYYLAALDLEKSLGDRVVAKVALSYARDELDGSDPDTGFNNFEIINDSLVVSPQLQFALNDSNQFVLGYTFDSRAAENVDNFDFDREINSVFLEYLLSQDSGVDLSLGARLDSDSEFGEEVTYRASLSYQIVEKLARLHTSFGTGFKAPTFNELFFPNFGNPDLVQETSIGFDVGLALDFLDGRIATDTTFFWNSFDDLIVSDSETFLAANIDEAKSLGIEFELAAEICDSLAFVSNYTWTDTENETTNTQLARRPTHKANFGFKGEAFDALEAHLKLLIVNDRIDTDGAEMDDYERVDLDLAWNFKNGLKPFVKAINLFNQDYEEVNGFESSDLAVYGGFEFGL